MLIAMLDTKDAWYVSAILPIFVQYTLPTQPFSTYPYGTHDSMTRWTSSRIIVVIRVVLAGIPQEFVKDVLVHCGEELETKGLVGIENSMKFCDRPLLENAAVPS